MEKEKTKLSKTANKTDTSKIYELGYILVSSLPDEKIAEEVESIKTLLANNGAEVISSEDPILIDLAYSMVKVVSTQRQKYSRGYFGWVKFEGEPEALAEIKKVLDLSATMLRYMTVKTVRENTLLNGKMVLRKEEREEVASDEVADEVVAESAEVLDKSIDDLVIA
jgi:ribosomal protein S6